MIRLLTLLSLIVLASPILALDAQLSRKPVEKPLRQVTPPPPSAEVLRQGGDTIVDAVALTVPASLTGSTVGYTDDYDEVCPYMNSTSPDVVYSLVLAGDAGITVDLLGSAYDTKVYVYDENLNLVGCNDDFHADYTSKLDVLLSAGVIYYLVIDGYGGDAGDYVLNVMELDDCELAIPADSVLEGEPPLVDGTGILDCHNGGCQFVDECAESTWQVLGGDVLGELSFHGRSGWYIDGGADFRDTDWFEVTFGLDGVIEIVADAEEPTYLFELGPQDCGTVGVVQNVSIGPCVPNTMTITGDVGSTAWIWVGPQTFTSPTGATPYEFDYLLEISGLEIGHVAVEAESWTGVKALYR